MANVTLTIDGITITVPAGTTILQAANERGIKIPTLCHHPNQSVKANCRVCVVEVEGSRVLQASCATPVSEGMIVKTNTTKAVTSRKNSLELILSHHAWDCHHCVRIGNGVIEDLKPELCAYCFMCNCVRDGDCELQRLAIEYDINQLQYEWVDHDYQLDKSTSSIVLDPNKCILCRRCIGMCSEIQTVHALGIINRGCESKLVPALDAKLVDSPCVMCGQCVNVCPVGAIYAREQFDELLDAVADREKFIIAQIDPSVFAEFAKLTGEASDQKNVLVSGLRNSGIDHVIDYHFTAGLTGVVERKTLQAKLTKGGSLPLLSAHCPGTVNFIESFYPDLRDKLSVCKSPQQNFGMLAKTYWAEMMDISPDNIYTVSITTCTANKAEAARPEMKASGYRDVDLVLTTREIIRLFKATGVNFSYKEATKVNLPADVSGCIVNEAEKTWMGAGNSLQSAPHNSHLKEVDFELEGIKLKAAFVNSLGNARQLLDQVQKGESPYHFIQVTACSDGCFNEKALFANLVNPDNYFNDLYNQVIVPRASKSNRFTEIGVIS